MALELNGTTGVSLVQDGVIATADLADDAVTAAKIGSLPTGSVLQVVQDTVDLTIDISTTSTSFVTASELELAITPSKANSTIFVVMRGFALHYNTPANNHGGTTTIMRSVAGGSFANVVNVDRGIDGFYKNENTTNHWTDTICNMQYLDSPTYTLGQEIVYRPGWRRSTKNSGGFYLNHTGGLYNNGGPVRVLGIAMEIAG